MAKLFTGIGRRGAMVCLAGVCLAGLSCDDPIEDTVASVTLALVNGRIWTGNPAIKLAIVFTRISRFVAVITWT